MFDLFPDESSMPTGFRYEPGFISPGEERLLEDMVRQIELQPMKFHGFEAKRLTASFGYDYSFDNRTLNKGRDIPSGFGFLIDKVAEFLSLSIVDIAELLVTEYPPGSVISWHRDAAPFGLIAGISLLSDCRFRLRPHEKARQNRRAVINVPLQRRSLYVMEGPAREEWQHSISAMAQTRLSVTLRTLK